MDTAALGADYGGSAVQTGAEIAIGLGGGSPTAQGPEMSGSLPGASDTIQISDQARAAAEAAASTGVGLQEAKEASAAETRDKVASQQTEIQVQNRSVQFSTDNDLGVIQARVIDRATQDVIRAIPPDDVLRFSAKFREMIGSLFDEDG